jgi:hypothetical protein
MEKYEDANKNIKIVANKINIGRNVQFGNNIDISIKGDFELNDFSRLGHYTQIRGNNVKFGKH